MERISFKNFWSSNSDVCNIQIPIVKNVQSIFGGRVTFEEINVDENKELTEKYNIKEIPTIIIECNGQERERFVGLTQERFLKRALKKILSERI